jgi:hypothetical protein
MRGRHQKERPELTGSCKWGHVKIYVSEEFAANGVVNMEGRRAVQLQRSDGGQDIELITSIGYLIVRESATQLVQQRPTGVFPTLQPHTPGSISPGGRGRGHITFQLSFSSTAYPHTAGVPESGTFPHNPARS